MPISFQGVLNNYWPYQPDQVNPLPRGQEQKSRLSTLMYPYMILAYKCAKA